MLLRYSPHDMFTMRAVFVFKNKMKGEFSYGTYAVSKKYSDARDLR